MRIVKTSAKPNKPRFWELLKVADNVRFDPRPGWLLVSPTIGLPRRKANPQWIHPEDVPVVWIREFRFEEHNA